MNNYHKNLETLNRYADGNSIVYRESKECPTCDCCDEHRCINCDEEITAKGCAERDGFCEYCSATEVVGNSKFRAVIERMKRRIK